MHVISLAFWIELNLIFTFFCMQVITMWSVMSWKSESETSNACQCFRNLPQFAECNGDRLHVEEGGDQVNPERHNDHFQGDHMHSKEGKHQVQLNAGSHGGHLQGVELGVHHIRCVHRSHLQSGFLN